MGLGADEYRSGVVELPLEVLIHSMTIEMAAVPVGPLRLGLYTDTLDSTELLFESMELTPTSVGAFDIPLTAPVYAGPGVVVVVVHTETSAVIRGVDSPDTVCTGWLEFSLGLPLSPDFCATEDEWFTSHPLDPVPVAPGITLVVEQ